MPRPACLTAFLLTLVVALVWPDAPAFSFVTFESGQVRPLALSPGGTLLLAVNTPDNRLEIFDVDPTSGDLTHRATVPVGLEPIAVAARTDTEIWVVNHLSDSVSIVDLSGPEPRVVRTLLVGDEPRDIVFAVGGTRAFVTCAHRGQQRTDASIATVPGAGDPELTTPGVGRADVWAFDATNLGATLGGTPLSIITFFGDTPRALAVSNDGNTVYAAVFHSGNQTTSISEAAVCDGGSAASSCTVNGVMYPGGLPAPNRDANGLLGPETGLVVRFDGAHWVDPLGRSWDNAVRFALPDDDVFRIDATQNPPAAMPSAPHDGQPFAHVGTLLFDMAVNPVSGRVYVTNSDSHNEVRFEGQHAPCGTPSSVVGHLSEARITVLDPSTGSVTAHHLNKHLDSGTDSYCTVPSPAGTADGSVSTPLGIAVTGDGTTLYVAAFGSSDPSTPGAGGQVAVFDTAALESGAFSPSLATHILLSGGGASGLVLNEARQRLYVMTRFDDAVSVVDISSTPGTEIQHLPVYNPEPAIVTNGRKFLYDATLTASNGEASCASCHPFADFDSLAWDLGNPDDVMVANPNPFIITPGDPGGHAFHPLKGPMATQTLRGMGNNGPMHWRGDRTGGQGRASDETLAFEAFNAAFPNLLGIAGHCSVTTSQTCRLGSECPAGEKCFGLSDADMLAFTQFILQVMLPPNPIRALDHSSTATEQAGFGFFFGANADIDGFDCQVCHTTAPARGQFGTGGLSSAVNEPQQFKVPHLRNLYQKVGMFGLPDVSPFIDSGGDATLPDAGTFMGDQVRGFGFLHDGSVDTLFRFLERALFSDGFADPGNLQNCGTSDPNECRRNVEAFMLSFETDLAPIVGQQITLASGSPAAVGQRIDLMIARAQRSECDVTVKGVLENGTTGVLEQRGLVRLGPGNFKTDRSSDPPLTDAQVRAMASTPGQELTYTCVPPGEGLRIGIDRDADGCPDRTELDGGTDPADPLSVPPGCTGGVPTTTTTTSTTTTTRMTSTTIACTDVPVTDAAAMVKVTTRNDAGKVRAKIALQLDDGYTAEPVTVSLSDLDTPEIARQLIGSLSPVGSTGRKWLFKTRNDGVQKVGLKRLGPTSSVFGISLKTKHWFTATTANQSEAQTLLTIQIGDLCFRHAATKKVD